MAMWHDRFNLHHGAARCCQADTDVRTVRGESLGAERETAWRTEPTLVFMGLEPVMHRE